VQRHRNSEFAPGEAMSAAMAAMAAITDEAGLA